MRAIRLVCDQKAPVERSSSTYAVGQCGRGLHNVGTTQTVAVGPNLLFLVHLRLRIEERNVGDSVFLCGPWREERCHCTCVLLSVGRIVSKIEGRVEHRSPVRPVEEIRDEHRISFGSDTLSETTNYGTESRGIMPEQYARMRTVRRMDEGRITNAVGRL